MLKMCIRKIVNILLTVFYYVKKIGNCKNNNEWNNRKNNGRIKKNDEIYKKGYIKGIYNSMSSIGRTFEKE